MVNARRFALFPWLRCSSPRARVRCLRGPLGIFFCPVAIGCASFGLFIGSRFSGPIPRDGRPRTHALESHALESGRSNQMWQPDFRALQSRVVALGGSCSRSSFSPEPVSRVLGNFERRVSNADVESRRSLRSQLLRARRSALKSVHRTGWNDRKHNCHQRRYS
jgi:hypothetical protein